MTTLLGTVTGPDGEPIAEASIYFVEGPVPLPLPDVAQLTDDEGRFQLAAPAPGTYRLGARAPGFAAAEVTVGVGGEAEVVVRLRLPAAPP